jgi:hypothetical protein
MYVKSKIAIIYDIFYFQYFCGICNDVREFVTNSFYRPHPHPKKIKQH